MTLVRHVIICASLCVAAVAAAAEPPVFERRGAAIRGYDPVAYFSEGKPVKGEKSITSEWNGSTWRFASTENRDAFVASPERYAPQYGGYCAWAVAQNYTASTVPEAFTIHGGKLYLNYSLSVQEKWRVDKDNFIRSGDANWPGVLE